MPHHDDYDTSPSQSKGYTPDELREYIGILRAHVLSSLPQMKRQRRTNAPKRGVSLELYDRRLPIYKAAVQFVRDVSENLSPDLRLIFKFSADMDEALFLFDEAITAYVSELSRQALRLHTSNVLRERVARHPEEEKNLPHLLEQQTEIVVWFGEQLPEIKTRFAPFLRVG